jgi:flagellar hook protein FlgE
MSLYSSFYASLSGLSANASALSVIGNNLANLNTVGFKGSSSSFQDLFNAQVGGSTQGNGNPIQVGLGIRLGSVSQNFAQGSFQSTANVLDMAVSGNGFFMVQPKTGGYMYTRAGNFTIDKSGALVDPNGNKVLGWNRVGNSLSTNGTVAPLQINMGTVSPPTASSTVSTVTNLDANAATGTIYSTPIQVYDSLGSSHSLLFTYTKTATAGQWSLGVTTDGGSNVSGFPATIAFDNAGNLTTPASTANPVLTLTAWANGAASPPMTWSIWNGSPAVANLTGFATDSATTSSSQDGFGAGSLRGITVDQSGVLTGNFTNGQTVPLGQVALATFSNMNGMSKQGDNLFAETLTSGGPNTGAANQGGRGAILGANLELSNVDVAEEFTKLIINQRGYQANSRIVTTSDELLQETLNLKR